MLRDILLKSAAFVAVLGAAPGAMAQAECNGVFCGSVPTDGGVPLSAAQVQALMPQPAISTPANPAPAGNAGNATTYLRGDAVTPSLTRSARAITAADCTFSVTWGVPLVSTTPVAHADPMVSSGSTQPTICDVTSASNLGVTGKCFTTQTVSLTLALVTAGLTVNAIGGGCSGLTVSVFSREPTN